MSSSNGTTTLMDWRDITERLLDPQQRRAIVTKASTDELQQLKTKNAFLKRKRRLLDQIRKNRSLNINKNTKKPDENSDGRSPNASPDRSSRCSELNFTNEEVPSTPPPTLLPTNGLPSAPNRSKHRQKNPNQSTNPSASKGSGSDSDTGTIDMGDYENRIRPSSAFWRKKDGMSLAEKIIYYRNWKYRNFPRREDNHQMAGEMESTLTDHRRYRSTRHAAKSAATLRRRNSLEEDRQRPVTVIPKVTERVTFPPIDNGRHVATTSSHYDVERERLPSIEQNQFVSRSPSVGSEKVREQSELKEYDVDDKERESVAETDIDAVDEEEKGEEEEKPEDEEETKPEEKDDKEEDEKPEEEKGVTPPPEEPPNPDDKAQDEEPPVENGAPSNPTRKKRRVKVPRVLGPRAPRPNGEPDKLIAKLNKKVERDLRTLQGQPKGESDDDDDTDVDEDTMNDILHGERGKELDNFLQVS